MQLSIQNIGQATFVIKDLEGYSDFVGEVASGNTETFDVTRDVVQRLAPTLVEMEENPLWNEDGDTLLVGIRWSTLHSDTLDDRALGEGLAGLPSLTNLEAQNYSTGGGATDVICNGSGLLGNQTKATLVVENAAGTAGVAFEAVTPGAAGNDISVVFVVGTGALTITVTSNQIEIETAAGGSTASAIATAVNADADALLLVQASEDTAGTFDEAIAEDWLEDGAGPGVSLTLGGTACSITALTDAAVTFDVASGIAAASEVVTLDFRNGPHLSRLSVPVVA